MKKTSLRLRESDIVETITLKELCRCCDVHADWIIELVDHGILNPVGRGRAQWRFRSESLVRARKAVRLNRDLGINLAGIALVLDLISERDRLARLLARHDAWAEDH